MSSSSSCGGIHRREWEPRDPPRCAVSKTLQKCHSAMAAYDPQGSNRDHPPYGPCNGGPRRFPLRDFNYHRDELSDPQKLPSLQCQSRVLDRWVDMVTAHERQADEGELRALCNSSSLLHHRTPEISNASPEVPGLRTSLLVQKWRELEAESVRASRMSARTASMSCTSSPRTNTPRSDAWSFAEEHSDMFDPPDERFRDLELDQTSPSSARLSIDASESGRGKVADIIKRFTSRNQTQSCWLDNHSIITEQSPSSSSKDSCLSTRSSENAASHRPEHLHNRRIIGWKDWTQFLMQTVRDRKNELAGLRETHPVSRFSHRGRIQSLIRFRFLRPKITAPDQLDSANSDGQDNLKLGTSILLLREIFNCRSQRDDNCFLIAHSTRSLQLQKPARGPVSEQFTIENRSYQEEAMEPLENEKRVIFHVSSAGEELPEQISQASDILESRRSLSTDILLDWREHGDSPPNLDNLEGDMLMEEVSSNSSLIMGQRDDRWLNASHQWGVQVITRPAIYDDLYEHHSSNVELQELHERRAVSTALKSDFREQMDRLILSILERQRHDIYDNAKDEYKVQHQMQSQDYKVNNNGLMKCTLRQSRSYDCGGHTQQRSYMQQLPHSMETELIHHLRGDMVRLHQEVDDLKRILQSCTDMQRELQHTMEQEVCTPRNFSGSQELTRGAKCQTAMKNCCCICYEMHVDSLLYRCGHMCTCFKCANELQWSTGRCPVCRAQIVDVVRAFLNQ